MPRSLPTSESCAEKVNLLETQRYRYRDGPRSDSATGAAGIDYDFFVFSHDLDELGFGDVVVPM